MSTPGEQQYTPPYAESPYGQAVAGAPRPSGRSGLAWTALILAGVAVVGSLAVSLSTVVLMYANRASFAATGGLNGLATIIFGLLAITALILGIFAARGSRPVVAGIAIGIAIAHLVSAMYGLLAPLTSMMMTG
ncbi:hypothetical protein [Microbacterium sp. G2-8]|uniref:hypothetical protein n=1 Tax=Microbacterium sp. G2-8 TaxID=2842454 RepID=UPI001C8ADC9E|nr:hypothetical protein [Microbacterium sp. G2-8]